MGRKGEAIDFMKAITRLQISGLTHVRSGKVREIFDLGDRYLMVATDRISAFDVVLPNGIPDKGKILNQLSAFWFGELSHIVNNHLLTTDDNEVAAALGDRYDRDLLFGRCMIVKKCEPLLVECVARKYIAGSLYKDYLAAGGKEQDVRVHGIDFPKGLRLCEELPYPIFTPATKAQSGHDENIDFDSVIQIVGKETATELKAKTLELFAFATNICNQADILLADTKFEFGMKNGEIILIDEALTPDSSRFWPKATYEVGKQQESLDKQFIRNYLETLDWDKTPPGPVLPERVVTESRERYIDIFKRITGRDPVL